MKALTRHQKATLLTANHFCVRQCPQSRKTQCSQLHHYELEQVNLRKLSHSNLAHVSYSLFLFFVTFTNILIVSDHHRTQPLQEQSAVRFVHPSKPTPGLLLEANMVQQQPLPSGPTQTALQTYANLCKLRKEKCCSISNTQQVLHTQCSLTNYCNGDLIHV